MPRKPNPRRELRAHLLALGYSKKILGYILEKILDALSKYPAPEAALSIVARRFLQHVKAPFSDEQLNVFLISIGRRKKKTLQLLDQKIHFKTFSRRFVVAKPGSDGPPWFEIRKTFPQGGTGYLRRR